MKVPGQYYFKANKYYSHRRQPFNVTEHKILKGYALPMKKVWLEVSISIDLRVSCLKSNDTLFASGSQPLNN